MGRGRDQGYTATCWTRKKNRRERTFGRKGGGLSRGEKSSGKILSEGKRDRLILSKRNPKNIEE